jgi:hypothetical protein
MVNTFASDLIMAACAEMAATDWETQIGHLTIDQAKQMLGA